jgi:hypothetical protein
MDFIRFEINFAIFIIKNKNRDKKVTSQQTPASDLTSAGGMAA